MPTINKEKLSGSTDGKNIKIAQTATPGTLIHTAKAGLVADEFDEVWIWVTNTDGAARKLTIEWGGTAAPDDLIEMTIPPESGPVLVVPGWILQNGNVVRAFGASANLLVATGFVNRMSAS